LKEVKDTPKNKLQHNEFRPSDPKEYFSLPEFGVMEKDVIWVDEANIQFSVEQVFNSTIIGIDTESTVARTTLSTTYELLSIVQIANGKHIFIFDAKFLKEKPFRSEIVNEFFRNEKNTVVGHTLEADLNEDVTKLFGYTEKVKCQKIDICPIFKKLYPGQRAGLAFISKTVLGKQICKEYTLTNWDRRPLFRNQLHYAALDAEVVLKIWDILKERKAEFESKSAPREKEDKEVPEKVEEEEKE
jgi:ribonuclease D